MLLIGLASAGLGILFLILDRLTGGLIGVLGVFLMIVGIFIIMNGISIIKKEAKKQIKEEEEKIEQERKRQQELEKHQKELEEKERREKKFRENKWRFPSYDFYVICKKNNITNLKSEYSIKKAYLIAQDIMKKYSVPQDCYALYLDDKKIIQYFNENYEMEQKKKELEYKTPHKVILSENETKAINFKESLGKYYGTEKRMVILTQEIKALKLQLEPKKKFVDSAFDTALSTLKSASYQPKKDWALLGGIADGIAGPAAGIAVANQIAKENLIIEQQNIINKQQAHDLAANIIDKELKIRGEISNIESKLKEKELLLDQLKYKIVFDEIDQKVLFDSMTFSHRICTYTKENELHFDLEIENNFSTKIAPEIKKVIDGTIQAKIYCDNVLVDEVCIDLPTMGLNLNGKYSSTFISRKYMSGKNRNYRFEFSPNKLWLMEY